MQRSRQSLWIVLLALLALGGWTLAHRWLPRAGLAETNFQANLIRLQAWMFEAPRTNAIIGSSLGGRLLVGNFAGTPLASLANLALDGSGPELGLRLVLARSNPPPRIFIEVHRLGKPWTANDETLLATLQEPGFALAGRIPGLRADTRPTTLLYSWLKGRHEPVSPAAVLPSPSASTTATNAATNTAKATWLPRLAEQVAELRRRGCEVILLRLPVGRENPARPEAPNLADELADKLGLKLIDLNREAARRGLEMSYSDGLHLSPASARTVCRLLVELTTAPP
jgi:hypothetical protein